MSIVEPRTLSGFMELLPPDQIKTEGIRNVTLRDVELAKKFGASIKLIGKAVRTGHGCHFYRQSCC